MEVYQEHLRYWDIEFTRSKVLEKLSEKALLYKDTNIYLPLVNIFNLNLYNHVNINDLIKFSLLDINHKYPINFSFSRGIVGYLKEEETNKVYCKMNMLDLFIIASNIRTWCYLDRGVVSTLSVYLNLKNNKIYCSKDELKLEEVKLLENELSNFNSKVGFEKKIDFVVNAFSKTVDYPREVLMNSKLVIPFVGMHEAIIVNDNTLNGYLYDKVSKNDESLLENKFDSIIELIENKFKEEKFNELFSKLLNEKSNFLKDEEIKKMIDELENISRDKSEEYFLEKCCKDDSLRCKALIYIANSDYLLNKDLSKLIANNLIPKDLHLIPLYIIYLVKSVTKNVYLDYLENRKLILESCCKHSELTILKLLYCDELKDYDHNSLLFSAIEEGENMLDIIKFFMSKDKNIIYTANTALIFNRAIINKKSNIYNVLWDYTDKECKDELLKLLKDNNEFNKLDEEYKKDILSNLGNRILIKNEKIDNVLNNLFSIEKPFVFKSNFLEDMTSILDESVKVELIELYGNNLNKILMDNLIYKLNVNYYDNIFSTINIDYIDERYLLESNLFWCDNGTEMFIYWDDEFSINEKRIDKKIFNEIIDDCKISFNSFKLVIVEDVLTLFSLLEINDKNKIIKFLEKYELKYIVRENSIILNPLILDV